MPNASNEQSFASQKHALAHVIAYDGLRVVAAVHAAVCDAPLPALSAVLPAEQDEDNDSPKSVTVAAARANATALRDHAISLRQQAELRAARLLLLLVRTLVATDAPHGPLGRVMKRLGFDAPLAWLELDCSSAVQANGCGWPRCTGPRTARTA